MTDRRPHDPEGLPKSLPPIETHQEYAAVLAALPDMEAGLEMMPHRSPLKLSLARIVSSMRQRVREYEAEHGRPPQP